MVVRIFEWGAYMNKKEEIISKTTELFSERGYHLTILEVANKVNLKPPSIYSHFKNKEELIEKVVLDEIENYFTFLNIQVEYLEDNIKHGFKEFLEKFFWSILGYFNNDNDKLRFWYHVLLIDNAELKEKCKGAIFEKETIYIKSLINIFKIAANQNQIDKSFHEGHVFLFGTMIHGILNSLFMCRNLIDLPASKTWNAYWDSIKVK